MKRIILKNKSILFLSDTHGKHRSITVPEKIDIIIHCGDICVDGDLEQILDFFQWYAHLQIPYKVFVNGNHDLPFELEPKESETLIPSNVIWLNDSSITLFGIRIKAISPFFYYHTPKFDEKVDILLSHYPPEGILDNGFGLHELREYVLKLRPKYHVFGHNHSGAGILKIGETQYINASFLK